MQSTRSPFVGEVAAADLEAERKRKEIILGQLPLEIEKGKGLFWGWDIDIYKCKGKILKYGEMAVAKCIFSFPHTILVEVLLQKKYIKIINNAHINNTHIKGETWILLNCLTVLCFATMAICWVTDSAESMGVSDVTGRVQLLLGFVLGYCFTSYMHCYF